MTDQNQISPLVWSNEHGLKVDVVMKLLRDAGIAVRSHVAKLSLDDFAKIEEAAANEKRKQDTRAKNLKKATSSDSEPASNKDVQETATTSTKSGTKQATLRKGTIKGTLKKKEPTTPSSASGKPVHKVLKPGEKPTLQVKKALDSSTEVKVVPKVEIKPEDKPVVSEKAPAPEVKPAPPKEVKVEAKPEEKSEARTEFKVNVPGTAVPKNPNITMMTPETELKKPKLKAEVYKPDAAILARIQKSKQQQQQPNRGGGNRRFGNKNQGNAQGYTGSFGPRNSGNDNNNNRNNNNARRPGGNGNSSSRGGYVGRSGAFSSGSMQEAFNASNSSLGNANASKNNANNRNQNNRHGNDKNRKNNSRDRMEQQKEQQQEMVRQNVSRVMADLSKKPVKKTYHKEHSQSAPGEEKKIIKTPDFITVGELAGLLNTMPARVIAKCMEMGMMVTINARLDFETIQVLSDEFGYEAQLMDEYEEEVLGVEDESDENLQPRHPVVTVMGHVDHGKTSLLDWIRKTHVVAGESGGITQHIGAYEVTTSVGKVTFLDTPGHEAFSAMRARGSQVTDVIVLVVAADSMVMPQTVESIELAKREKVPLVVAITKIDLPTANPDKIRAQLAERGVEVEQWGGQTSCIEVSARSGQGMDQLLETLALETEVLELKANPDARAKGAVVESKLDVGKGSMATILVQNGTLHVGDPFVCGIYAGRVRAMFNERGEQVKVAPPSAPCQVLGFDGTPQAGDELVVVEDEKTAREIASKRRQAARERTLRGKQGASLEKAFNEQKEGKLSELNLIVKADVGGSAEALAASLEKLTNKEVRVNIIGKSVGTITENDILMATTSKAIIVAFHLMPSVTIREMAQKEGIEIRTYRVIYDCIEDITNAVEGLLKPITREELCGEAEIREVFKIPKVGLIAGCMVTDGEVDRTSHVRVYRGDVELGNTVVQSLKRHKDDVKSVARGFECGIGLRGYEDIQNGDRLVFFKEITVARTLKDVAREEAAEKAKKENA